MGYSFFLAGVYLFRRKKTGWISLITWVSVAGIAIGVMALIVVLAVMSGFDRELKSKIIGMNPHVLIQKSGGVDQDPELLDRIVAMNPEGIESASRLVQGQAILQTDTSAQGVMVRGVDMERDDLAGIKQYIKAGRFFFRQELVGEQNMPGLVLGKQLAQSLSLRVGDTVDIITPNLKGGRLSLKKVATATFKVQGIFFAGMNDFDSGLALVEYGEAQRLFGFEGFAGAISLRLKNVDHTNDIADSLRSHFSYPFSVITWIDMNYSFFSALKVEKAVMSILLFLIIIVAAFNIVSSLTMIVMEKTRDIGLLKALGATGFGIRMIFLIEGVLVGVIGVATGSAAGWWVATNINGISDWLERTTGLAVFPSDIYFFSEIPVELNVDDLIPIAFAALAAASVGAFYPAHKAANLKPAESLRYE